MSLPSRERGLKSCKRESLRSNGRSLPSRERGLKSAACLPFRRWLRSLPSRSDTDSRIASIPSQSFPQPDQNVCTCHDTCAIIALIPLLTAPHRLLRRFAGKEKNQMKAYFDSIEKEVPEQLQQVFLNRRDTAVITIDMHCLLYTSRCV